jgi:hypothetical protein
MANVKEIKSIQLAPFTLMSSSLAAILAFIYALIILVISGILIIFVPQLELFRGLIAGLGVASVIIFPISAYFIIIAVSFFTAILYNCLASRIGGIKLGLENNDVIKIPIIHFSLILAIIEAICAFIIGLFSSATITPFTTIISNEIPVVLNTTNHAIKITGANLPTSPSLGTDGFTLAFFLIIGLPIAIFIFGFISNALFAVFYNYIATRFIKIQLEFRVISGTLNELRSLPVVPTAAPIAGAVFAVFGVIMGFISLLSLAVTGNPSVGNIVNDIIVLIINGLIYFIGYFLIFALIAVIYNFLSPRIGGIKLNLQ